MNPDPLFVARAGLYASLLADSAIWVGDQILTDFKDSIDAANIGTLYKGLGDFANATELSFAELKNSLDGVTAVSPVTMQETYQQRVEMIALDCWLNEREPDAVELDTLRSIAALCPFIDGEAVYLARTLVAPYDTTEFINDCELAEQGEHRPVFMTNETGNAAFEFSLYPNPANGAFTAQYLLDEAAAGEMQVFNTTGQVVKRLVLETGDRVKPVDMTDLTPGVYFYQVKVNGEVRRSDRMVIIK